MIRKPARLINKSVNTFLLIGAIFASAATQALPDDTQQEIRISSDKASLDREKGLIVYTGNVKMQQGTLSIEADRVTLIRNQQGLQKVTANGKPAKYEQILSENEDKTHAYGNTIIYRTDIEKLTLIENAGLKKSGNLFTGERIVYSIKDQQVQADGQSQDKSDGRIKMVIQPQDAQTSTPSKSDDQKDAKQN